MLSSQGYRSDDSRDNHRDKYGDRRDRVERARSPDHGGRRHHPYERPRSNATALFETPDGVKEVGRRIYVGNLSFRTTWQDLKDHMKQAGEVLHADVLVDKNGRHSGGGIVEFASPDDAANAIRTLQDTELVGRPIFLREDREDVAIGGSGRPPRKQSSPPPIRPNRPLAPLRSFDPPPSASTARSPFAGLLDPFTYGQMYARYAEMMAGGERGTTVDEYYRTLHGASAQVNITGRAPIAHPTGGTTLYVGNLAYSVSWQTLKDVFREHGFRDVRVEINEAGGKSKGSAIVRFDDPQQAAQAISQLHDFMLMGRPMDVHYDKFETR